MWAADRILNDGLYGLLAEFRDLGMPQDYKLWRAGHKLTGPVADYTVFGPACDNINYLSSKLHLPTGGARGDYLLFSGMGACSVNLATGFNGYGGHDAVAVCAL